MSDVEAYFDESQSDRFFCLAGYIFERQNRIALCKAWSQILRDHGMPYWHMKEATGPSGVFKGPPPISVSLSPPMPTRATRPTAIARRLKRQVS
jgi:hypothetical protein